MKKEFLRGLTMLAAIVALAFVTAVASNAQSSNSAASKQTSKASHQLIADIPFEFNVDYKTMPAGEYSVQTVATASDALLIQSADGKNSALRPSEATERSQKNATARLVFHRYGQRYFLAEVWSGGDRAGRQLMKSHEELDFECEGTSVSSKGVHSQSSYEIVEVVARQSLARVR